VLGAQGFEHSNRVFVIHFGPSLAYVGPSRNRATVHGERHPSPGEPRQGPRQM
jgi:hypothetical protein